MIVFRKEGAMPLVVPIRNFWMLLLALLAGCGSVEHKLDLQAGYTPVLGSKVEVGNVTNETGQSFDVDVEQMLADALAEVLREKNLLWTGQGYAKLVLSSKLVEYEKGNAFKRWLLPGWGSTVLTVNAELRSGEKLVGYEHARRTVSIGGAYSIGAWKSIFRSIAEDIVDDFDEKIPR